VERAATVRANYRPVDLCRISSEIASSFRSTIEKAGLHLDIACEFLARELLARVGSNIRMAEVRREASRAILFSEKREVESGLIFCLRMSCCRARAGVFWPMRQQSFDRG
jgi:hypothetical protein